MRIAQVAPLFESVPPRLYGGTERVVSWLTEELVGMGHEVTLFASGDSQTSARLISPCDRALRLEASVVDRTAPHILMLEQVFSRAGDFDVIHFHTDYLHFSLSRRTPVRGVTTLHGRLDLPELTGIFKEFGEMPVVSISNAQREPVPWLNWQATIHHGLPADRFGFHERSAGYLAFLGRISYEKGLDDAIAIARAAGLPLRIAAKLDAVDRGYFTTAIEPLLRQPGLEFLGEIPEADKEALIGDAAAVLFPIRWPEPFGLVMIEAMTCGTPVIAFPHGSVPEIVDDGVTGVLARDASEGVEAVARALSLDRREVRRRALERFSVTRMALDYLSVYDGLTRPSSGHEKAR